MTRPVSLPGYVPTTSSPQSKVAVPATAQPEGKAKPTLRGDFARQLETRLNGWIGRPDTDRFKNLLPVVKPYLKDSEGDEAQFDLDKLPENAKSDLLKLQDAAQGIESIFVKKLLAQMRSATFATESSGPMADFAKDMMDQTLADQAAKGKSSIGIAKMIFLDTAQPLVRTAIAKPQGQTQGKGK